jgi:hypothetical protein
VGLRQQEFLCLFRKQKMNQTIVKPLTVVFAGSKGVKNIDGNGVEIDFACRFAGRRLGPFGLDGPADIGSEKKLDRTAV